MKSSPPQAGERGRWRRIAFWTLLALAGATGLGLVATAQASFATFPGESISFWSMARYWLPDYYLWAALSPLILWLGWRFRLDRESWPRFLPLHVAAAVAVSQLELLASCWVISIIAEMPAKYASVWQYYVDIAGSYSLWGLIVYLFIFAAGQAHLYYRRLGEREVEATELRRQVVEAQLRALRMQLHPHFLFNTLHSIGGLIRTGQRDTALGMLAGLGDLLRYSLDNGDRQEIPLEEEIEFVRRYLAVERVRFSDRLTVRIEAEERVLGAAVPNMILQPLVENALEHGIAPSAGGRCLKVSARRRGRFLRLEVQDDGPARSQGWAPDEGSGVGLRNVRERLGRLYGRAGRLRVAAAPDAGVVSVIDLPWKIWEEGA
jgi:two-component system LytT family sensor kinase